MSNHMMALQGGDALKLFCEECRTRDMVMLPMDLRDLRDSIEEFEREHSACSICAWHGPEGDTCEAPATSGDLCGKHRALFEMLQEPPRSACNEEAGVRVRYSGTHEFEAGGPIAPGSRVMVDSRGRLVTWDRDGWAVGATIQEPAGRAEKAGDIVVVYLFETPIRDCRPYKAKNGGTPKDAPFATLAAARVAHLTAPPSAPRRAAASRCTCAPRRKAPRRRLPP